MKFRRLVWALTATLKNTDACSICFRGWHPIVEIFSLKQVVQRYSFILVLILGGTLSSCASMEHTPPTFSPERLARIRVFHGTSAYLYLGDVCDGNSHPAIHAAAGGFSYLVRNKTIGMPSTEDMPSFSYHEYAIPTGQPVTVKMYWQAQNASGTWERCGPIHVMFTPEPGQDYDTFMKFESGVCQGVEVRKFVAKPDGRITTEPALLNELPFRSCR